MKASEAISRLPPSWRESADGDPGDWKVSIPAFESHEQSPGEQPRGPRRLPGSRWFCLAALVLSVVVLSDCLHVRYHRQRQLIARLEALRAECGTTIVAPDWLRRLLGDRWLTPFERLTSVFFNHYPRSDLNLADEDLSFLADLTNVEHLSLNRTRVTDDALVHLEGLRSLRILGLVDTDITDDAVEHLMKLTQLQELDLYRTQVTADGVNRLRTLPNLRSLRAPDGGWRD
jgi:hypothetical protein